MVVWNVMLVDHDRLFAAALRTLIEDEAEWRKRSELARSNAARFVWSRCSQPLVDLFAERMGP